MGIASAILGAVVPKTARINAGMTKLHPLVRTVDGLIVVKPGRNAVAPQ